MNRYAFSGARGGAYSYGRTGRYGKSRFRRYRPNGYTRRAGLYGRFGTGRGMNAQIEKKFLDTQMDFQVDLTVENVGSVVLLAMGAGPSQRVGNKAIVKSVQWRGNVVLPPGANSQDTVGLYLVQDTQANGTNATCQEVFTSATLATMMRNIDNGSRFKVLYKTLIELNANAGEDPLYDGDQKLFEGFIKVNVPIKFNSASSLGDIANIKTNNLFWLAGSTITDDIIGISMKTRIRYTDL